MHRFVAHVVHAQLAMPTPATRGHQHCHRSSGHMQPQPVVGATVSGYVHDLFTTCQIFFVLSIQALEYKDFNKFDRKRWPDVSGSTVCLPVPCPRGPACRQITGQPLAGLSFTEVVHVLPRSCSSALQA